MFQACSDDQAYGDAHTHEHPLPYTVHFAAECGLSVHHLLPFQPTYLARD